MRRVMKFRVIAIGLKSRESFGLVSRDFHGGSWRARRDVLPSGRGWWFPILRFGTLYPCPSPRTNLNPDTSERTLLFVGARTFSPPRVDRSPPLSFVRRRSSGSTGSARVVSRPSIPPDLLVPCFYHPSARSSSTFVGGGNAPTKATEVARVQHAALPTSTRSDYARASFIVTQRAPPRARCVTCVPACERANERANERACKQSACVANRRPARDSHLRLSLSLFPLSASPPLVFSLFSSRFYVSRKAKSVAFRAGWCARRLAHPGSYQHGRKSDVTHSFSRARVKSCFLPRVHRPGRRAATLVARCVAIPIASRRIDIRIGATIRPGAVAVIGA